MKRTIQKWKRTKDGKAIMLKLSGFGWVKYSIITALELINIGSVII